MSCGTARRRAAAPLRDSGAFAKEDWIIDISAYGIMAGSDFYQAKTVILATGVLSTGTLPGEQEKVGHGVSYCATCDGMLYRGKTIAVIRNNARFEHEVKYLAELADMVYYFPGYKGIGELPANVGVMEDKAVGVLGEGNVAAHSATDYLAEKEKRGV